MQGVAFKTRWSRIRSCVAAAAATAGAVAAGIANPSAAAVVPIDPARIDHGYSFAASQLNATVATGISATQFPATTNATTGQWITRSSTDWRAGFFPGQHWLMYDRTGDVPWRDNGARWTTPLATSAITHDHDIGFVTMTSWGHALHLGATAAYREAARGNILANAQILADRFKPAVGLIDSWINLQEPNGVCIDNMMNLELLFTAHALGGSQAFYDVGIAHAQTSRQRFIRADGGTYHVVRHLDSGPIERKNTMQGYGDETTWSRGQAWAIHGFSTTYRFTRDPLMLDAARRTADYFLAQLPAHLDPASNPHNALAGDFVPPSDFDAERGEPDGPWNDADNDGVPNESNSGSRAGPPPVTWVNDRLQPQNSYTLRDSSAAAIAAAGLFDLARLVPSDTPENEMLRAAYFQAGRDMLDALLTHESANATLNYLADGATAPDGSPLRSILARGSERWGAPNNGLSYGDYYLLQAMARYEEVGLDFLPLSVGNQWKGDSGQWGDATAWTGGFAPGGVGQAAHFRTLATADTMVTLDAPRTVGLLTFNHHARTYRIHGTHALRLERGGGAEAEVRVEASPTAGHEISAPVTLASDTSITVAPGASLTIAGSLAVAPGDSGARNLNKLGEGQLRIAGPQNWTAGSTLRFSMARWRSPAIPARAPADRRFTCSPTAALPASKVSSG